MGIRQILPQTQGHPAGQSPTLLSSVNTGDFQILWISYPQCGIRTFLLSLRLGVDLVDRGKEGLGGGQIWENIKVTLIFKEYFTSKHEDTYNFFLKVINSVKNNF